MRTTLNLDDDAALAARNLAQRQRVSLGKAVSELVRRGAAAGGTPMPDKGAAVALRGRYALLPARDEIIMPQQVRDLMEREGI
jgi:hypothetical protein